MYGMKRLLITLLLTAIGMVAVFGIEPVTVAESTLRINAHSEEEFYYGFAAGDELIFSFREENGFSLKEIEIVELPGSVKYMDYKVKKLEKKSIQVMRTGIYKFRFTNTSITGRVCNILIQRIPAENKTRNFNSSVYWRTVQDTIYESVQEKNRIKRDTVAQTLVERVTKIASSSLLNSAANKDCIDFTLPKGTVSWSYYIGVGTEAQKAYAKAKSGFLNSAASTASRIPGYGSMAALALYGFNAFSLIQGEDNVKFWFMGDEVNAGLFKSSKKFNSFKQSNVLSDAAQMKNPLSGHLYLGLLNDNMLEAINVTVSVTAIVVTEQNALKNNKIMKISPRREAYLMK